MLYIKQYGEKRTGTNLVRAMLGYYFDDMIILMHIPGDKHGMPIDYHKLRNSLMIAENPLDVLKQFSESVASETTNFSDPNQLSFLEKITSQLQNAIVSEQIAFCISIKNPFAWISSISRWDGWRVSDMFNKSDFLPYIRNAMNRYNRKYHAWLQLKHEFPERVCIVRYEHLLVDPFDTINQIASTLGAEYNKKPANHFNGIFLPCHWDNESEVMHHASFDKTFYNENKYLNFLPGNAKKEISKLIDEKLMCSYGYNMAEWMKEKIA